MSSQLTEANVNAAARAAFNISLVCHEAHPFMTCDFFCQLAEPIKVAVSNAGVYTNGAVYSITIFGKKFRTFVHYSQFGNFDSYHTSGISYLEFNSFKKNEIEVVCYAFGRKFTRYIPIGLS